MSELQAFVVDLSKKLDSETITQIERILKVNGFTTRLQIKLISEKDLETMFQGSGITMGAKNLLLYHIQLLRDESPLVVKSKKSSTSAAVCENIHTTTAKDQYLPLHDSDSDDSDTYDRINKQPKSKGVLSALHTQKEKLKNQITRERQECLELEMNVESMVIEVKEPPPIGKSRLVCGYCHHRGHRNTGSQPCKMKKCMEYTYCGLKDKHPEYFSKLNSLKVELKKKKSALQEIETQVKSMDDFTTGSEFSFVKNLTPRMYAVDPSYKVNKAKLMRDVRLLRTFLDGKIPVVTANDTEQLRILISKCKKNVGIPRDTDVDVWANNTTSVYDASPIKNEDTVKEQLRTERTDKAECFIDQRNKKKHKRKKQKKAKKVKKRRRERRSSSSSEDDRTSKYSHNVNAGTFPSFDPRLRPNSSYNFPIPYPENPYFYSSPYNPPFNPVPGLHGPYASQYNNTNIAKAKRGNTIVSSMVSDNHQHITSNNTNLFEDHAAPFSGSLDVRFTTTLTPPKSSDKTCNEQGSWDNLAALADAAVVLDENKSVRN